MIVRFSESIIIDPALRYAVFAFAGKIEVYQRGMSLRDAVKAIMATRGVTWYSDMAAMYPANDTYVVKPRKPRTVRLSSSEGTLPKNVPSGSLPVSKHDPKPTDKSKSKVS